MTVHLATWVQRYLGVSTDSKPAGVPVNSTFFETNTGSTYVYDGAAWSAVPGSTAPAGTPVLYRSAVVAADVLAAVGTITCTNPATGRGGLTAATYHISVSAGRIGYGRGVAVVGNTTVATSGSNLSLRAAFAAVANADWYDIFCTTAANPLWVGRITEAQRASGIAITAVGTTAAGVAVAGAVDIEAIGTGLADNVQAQSTAYIPDHLTGTPTALGTGKQYVDIDLVCTRTGDAVAAALTVIPFLQNTVSGIWSASPPQPLSFGVASGVYDAMTQRLRIPNQGQLVHVAVAAIAGTGMSVDMYLIPS